MGPTLSRRARGALALRATHLATLPAAKLNGSRATLAPPENRRPFTVPFSYSLGARNAYISASPFRHGGLPRVPRFDPLCRRGPPHQGAVRNSPKARCPPGPQPRHLPARAASPPALIHLKALPFPLFFTTRAFSCFSVAELSSWPIPSWDRSLTQTSRPRPASIPSISQPSLSLFSPELSLSSRPAPSPLFVAACDPGCRGY
ncbi:hypothetical protein BDY21DRAFT_347935 [Lineolata rhizophorae]|uniref:Uncharacterized protein n=1 Tax=Lineolata rhizophorae TaxID=578093 RepID=A0A6A6NWL1_9PEZI|nr:hypothetical protein BDY21DRAFT_347935 [Lineolata rhizophorae]